VFIIRRYDKAIRQFWHDSFPQSYQNHSIIVLFLLIQAKGIESQITDCFVVPPRKDTLIWYFGFVGNSQILLKTQNLELKTRKY
jgi:hypothetical protein